MNNYSALIATIRKEYEILHKENQQLKIKIQKLEDYNTHQQLVDYNKRVMKKLPKRKINYQQAVYYDDVDGYENEYEENLSSDEDNDDNDLEEEEKKNQLKKNPKYLKCKKKSSKKCITKSIKM